MSDPNAPQAVTGQTELAIAIVDGEPMSAPPEDLYIPPDALEVILEAFEGPLDLLLYLIKRQNLDILNIPVADITEQYMAYIGMMETMKFELAAEYMLMAAMLAEIKSRMLLPRPVEAGDEDDPRAELVRRLQEYEQFKKAAEDIDALPRVGREVFPSDVAQPEYRVERPQPKVELRDMLLALSDVLKRADMFTHHQIKREPLSLRQRMSDVLAGLKPGEYVDFTSLFRIEEGRRGVVVTLLAVLELLKAHLIDLVQNAPLAPIHVVPAEGAQEDAIPDVEEEDS